MMRHIRLLAVILFLGVLFAFFEASGLRDHFSLAFVQRQIMAHEVYGLLAFVLLFSLGNLIHIPGWLFLAAAVLALGSLWGGVATYAAACFSCGFTFLIVRTIGGDALRQLENRLALSILRHLDARPLTSVFMLRMLFQTLPAVNYALALSGIRFRQYLAGTLLGLPLPIMLYCIFFDSLAKLLKII